VYNRDVVFREVKDVIKHEVLPKEPEKIEFELKEEESDSTTKDESEDEEPQIPTVRDQFEKEGSQKGIVHLLSIQILLYLLLMMIPEL